MIVCEECKSVFENNYIFIRHVSLTHRLLNTFKCNESFCRKSFSLLNSFIKHRRSKHHDNNEKSTSVTSDFSFSLEKHQDLNKSENDTVTLEFSAEKPSCVPIEYECSDSSDSESLSEENLLWDHVDSPSFLNLTSSVEKDIFNDSSVKLCGKLYQYPDLPRKRINDIIADASDLFQSTLAKVQSDVCNSLKSSGASQEYLSEIKEIFTNFSEPFQGMKTEKQRFSKFKNLDTFIIPSTYKIGERTEFKCTPTETTQNQISVIAQFIPMRRVLKKFFELPEVYNKTMEYISSLDQCTDIVSNIITSPFWKEKSSRFENKIVLPLLMYFDDYENNNPLGSHKGISKCGAVYLSVACLPPEFQSKIENIFLFILFNSLDRVAFKNSIIFEKVLQELEFLQNEGITINLPTGEFKLYFDLALIIGDNLGLHSILGLVESFSANKFCRFCLTNFKDKSNVYSEKDCTLRNVENYKEMLKKGPSISGINENCVFNKLPGFHVTNNPAVDIQHDFLEGICRYDLAIFLHHFIYERKYLTLEHLNAKIHSFYYGAKNSINKPPEILESHLKKKYIVLSSAEMLNLMRNLNLIIGLSIDENDEHWKLFLCLQEILQIVCATNITQETPQILETIIAEYLTDLNEIFPNWMKPKHHFLVHYPSVMRQIGPLWNICCIRFEAKHQESKKVSRTAICRVNTCRTIALRHQLIFNYRLMCQNSTYKPFICNGVQAVPLKKFSGLSNFIHLLPNHLLHENLLAANCIQFLEKTIKENSVVVIFSELGEEFYVVKHMILNGDNDFILVVKQIKDVFLNEHLKAYKIYNGEDNHFQILHKADLESATISYTNKLRDGHYYISKLWF